MVYDNNFDQISKFLIRVIFDDNGQQQTRLAQLEERSAFNRVVVGSIPTSGACFFVDRNGQQRLELKSNMLSLCYAVQFLPHYRMQQVVMLSFLPKQSDSQSNGQLFRDDLFGENIRPVSVLSPAYIPAENDHENRLPCFRLFSLSCLLYLSSAR